MSEAKNIAVPAADNITGDGSEFDWNTTYFLFNPYKQKIQTLNFKPKEWTIDGSGIARNYTPERIVFRDLWRQEQVVIWMARNHYKQLAKRITGDFMAIRKLEKKGEKLLQEVKINLDKE